MSADKEYDDAVAEEALLTILELSVGSARCGRRGGEEVVVITFVAALLAVVRVHVGHRAGVSVQIVSNE